MNKIRVLIADDSALMRQLLAKLLSADPAIEVVGAVSNAYKAREAIKQLNPDVLTLDIEMPKMDGISFLEKLMRLRPMPVVMISAMTEKGADITMRALMLGAVDFIHKPRVDLQNSLEMYGDSICEKVRTAALSHVRTVREASRDTLSSGKFMRPCEVELIAIGASTGGVEAIHKLLHKLPAGLPPIVVTQHIPPVFSSSFAQRLQSQLEVGVSEARNGQLLERGHVYIAPGDQHLLVRRSNGNLKARLDNRGPVNRHMPSVDVLFDSVAGTVKQKAIGILLTGMGSDGAQGLLGMRQAGAETIAQDEASSIVWGMPREAALIGAATQIVSLDNMPAKIIGLCEKPSPGGNHRGGTRIASA